MGKPQTSAVLDKAQSEIERYNVDSELLKFIEQGYYSVGSLGGGNHFIEIQEDENGMACIMAPFGKPNVRQHDRAVFQQDSP